MRVLVFSATGFIGHEVALAFRRAGHDVVGTTRSEASAKRLRAEEINAHVCDPTKVEDWRDLIRQVDVVIDCVGGEVISSVAHQILDTVIEEAAKHRPQGPPLSYIYCSGTWVHGDNKVDRISDHSPIHSPMPLTKWRLGVEQKAIRALSPSFTANVVRPSLVYGAPDHSLIGMLLFKGAQTGTITWYGDEDTRLATIHREDLGEAFRLVGEKAYAIPGIIFDISNNSPEALTYVLSELRKASGATQIEYKTPDNDFLKAVASTALLKPSLARSLLGWEPRRLPLADDMQTYYQSWLASQ